MIIEHTIPLLSAGSGFLGAAVMGYRVARRAVQVKKAIKAKIAERREDREVKDKINAVVKMVEGQVTGIDKDKAIALLEILKSKAGI